MTNKSWGVLRYIALVGVLSSVAAAQEMGIQPEWWFGGGLGINYNIYSANVLKPNANVSLPAAFSKGSGAGLQLGLLVDYRPSPMWGGILGLGFDSRSGKFDDVSSGGNHSLSTSLNYLSLEASVRFTPFASGFHLFVGPRFGFGLSKSFDYTGPSTSRSEDWSDVRGVNIGGQLGAAYDIPLTSPDARLQIELSPRAAVHFGQGVRSVEEWTVTTLRFGVDVKFATTTESRRRVETALNFSVQSPSIIPKERRVQETFPMRNDVFFDERSTAIPQRYTLLSPDEAASFKEEQLLDPAKQLLTGRSARQKFVYYNILNVVGDRLRRYPRTTITLTGASENGSDGGRAIAESIKQYLVTTFGITPDRIETTGRERPEIPSYQPGGTRDVDLVKTEDRRVDITSSNLEMLLPVRIISLQEEPLDADIILNVTNAPDILASWSVEVTDDKGGSRQFGPFSQSQERIPGNAVLGDKTIGDFRIKLTAETKDGGTVTKEEKIRLARSEGPAEQMGLRFSILFEFDQSKTVATYERFLKETVVPTITDRANVIIHGHTDIVGEEGHNLELSRSRANETMNVIQKELVRLAIKGVKFDTFGFGEDIRRAPFENRLPEERFYNRTVIIDIVPQ